MQQHYIDPNKTKAKNFNIQFNLCGIAKYNWRAIVSIPCLKAESVKSVETLRTDFILTLYLLLCCFNSHNESVRNKILSA